MITSKVNEDQRRQMIAEAAYFRAERRGFIGGDPVTDWFEAEIEVDERLRAIEQAHVLECLENGLASATKKLGTLKRKTSSLTSGARAEIQREVAALTELRDSLSMKVKEFRELGAQAGQSAIYQAEKTWDELSDAMRRLGGSASH
jgi:hypothetical protein